MILPSQFLESTHISRSVVAGATEVEDLSLQSVRADFSGYEDMYRRNLTQSKRFFN